MNPILIHAKYRPKSQVGPVLVLLVGIFTLLTGSQALNGQLFSLPGIGSILGLIISAIFLIPAIFATIDDFPVIEISSDGLVAREISDQLIRWQDIKGAKLTKFGMKELVEIELKHEAIKLIEFRLIHRIRKSFGTLIDFGFFNIATTELDEGADFIFGQIENHINGLRNVRTADV